jgi:glycerol-3-phosphate acyltransferase PlsY
MRTLAWTLIAFLSGSIPYSLWIGRMAGGVDIRTYGDANPGATNVLRALGRGWAALAGLLDGLKGAVPVGLAWHFAGLRNWDIVPVALAPVLGHAFSPFLRGHGGKAVAVTFGIWAGLTLGAGPTVLGLLLALNFLVLDSSSWAAVISLAELGGFILPYYAPVHPQFALIWFANLLVMVWKHRQDLSQPPRLQKWLLRLANRANPR